MTKRELIAICEKTPNCDSCDYKHDCDNFMEEMPSSPAYYIRIVKHTVDGCLKLTPWIDDVIQEHFV